MMSRAEHRGSVAEARHDTAGARWSRLWLGVWLAPAAWVAMEWVGYYLSSQSCAPGIRGVPLLGTHYPAVVQVLLAVVLIVAAVAGLLAATGSMRVLGSRPEETDSVPVGRSRFLAVAGVAGSALFLYGLVLFGLPPFFVNACSGAR